MHLSRHWLASAHALMRLRTVLCAVRWQPQRERPSHDLLALLLWLSRMLALAPAVAVVMPRQPTIGQACEGLCTAGTSCFPYDLLSSLLEATSLQDLPASSAACVVCRYVMFWLCLSALT
ncbi:hypothetical protein COO60DRAFT_1037353 [Scenedesmus sp. NREL 46B-D3]|nr:hypothetical protein COO60DRAFT_1037353 [Scenedesmus sp. NREL 46B-D3]